MARCAGDGTYGPRDHHTGKGEKRRRLPLNTDAWRALVMLGYEAHTASNTPLFLGQRRLLTPSSVQRLRRKYAHTAHLEVISPHRVTARAWFA